MFVESAGVHGLLGMSKLAEVGEELGPGDPLGIGEGDAGG
jgi:hypothetical protein